MKKATNHITKPAGRILGLSLALSFAFTLSMAQRFAEPVVAGEETNEPEIFMKNPGSPVGPGKSSINAPIVVNPVLTGIHMVDKGHDHIVVGWNQSVNYDSIYFRITDIGTLGTKNYVIAGNPNPGSFFLTGLSELTTYDVEISTLYRNTYSAWSVPLRVTTFAAPNPRLLQSGSNNRGSINMVVSPNPATTHTMVSFSCIPHKTYEISIVNMIGTSLFKVNVYSADYKMQVKLDVSDLNNGLYYIIVDNGSNSFAKPMIKQ